MRFLILEDELHNFILLQHILHDLYPDCVVNGPITSIEQAQRYLSDKPDVDIIIADIQLNDGLSFDALTHAVQDIPIIFTTAYDEHALRAFEFNSLSYLLKPIDENELSVAIKKAQKLLKQQENNGYRNQFVVKTSKGEKIIPIEDIYYIVSEQKGTYIKLEDGHSYLIDVSLESLSKELNPKYFMRVNRKYIIPRSRIGELESIENGRKRLILKGEQSPQIIISRERKNIVLAWINR